MRAASSVGIRVVHAGRETAFRSEGAEAGAGAMLVACRLAGLSALEGHYAGVRARAQSDRGIALDGACTLYDVRPHACASIFHASPCFENVYARVPVRAAVWPLMVTISVAETTAYALEPSTFENPIS